MSQQKSARSGKGSGKKSGKSRKGSRKRLGFQANKPADVAKGRGMGRRQFLSSMGLAAASVPFLEFFAGKEAFAQTASNGPKRFIVFVHGQGTSHNHWRPGPDFSLPYLLEPLEPWKEHIVVVDGVNNVNGTSMVDTEGFDGHQGPFASALTAQWMSQPPLSDGISIDQEIAGHIGADTPFRSLNLGIGYDANPITNMIYSGPQQPLSSNNDPANVFDTVFGGVSESPDEVSIFEQQQLSVLESTRDQFQSFRARLGHEDRMRLDAHEDRVRQLENEIRSLSDRLQSCTRPDLNLSGGYDYSSPDWWPETSRTQFEMMAMSMACDLTRVGTLMFTDMHAPNFPFLAADGQSVVPFERYTDWHDMVHNGFAPGGDPEQAILDGFRWYGEQFAVLLETLSSYEDVDGDNLLDTTCILWISDQAYGNWHLQMDVPIVLAGNCGGPMGRYLDVRNSTRAALSYDEVQWNRDFDYTNHNLFVSLLNAFGVDSNQFGDYGAGGNPGGLPGLLG